MKSMNNTRKIKNNKIEDSFHYKNYITDFDIIKMIPKEDALRKLLFSEKLSNPIRIHRNGVCITDFEFLDFSTKQKLPIYAFGFFRCIEECETALLKNIKLFTFDILKCLEFQLFDFYGSYTKDNLVVYSKEFIADVSDHVFGKHRGNYRFVISMHFNEITVRVSDESPVLNTYLLDFPCYYEERNTFREFVASGSKTKSVRS